MFKHTHLRRFLHIVLILLVLIPLAVAPLSTAHYGHTATLLPSGEVRHVRAWQDLEIFLR